MDTVVDRAVRIPAAGVELDGNLVIPAEARGVVLFAHGSGSSRHSSRNRFVAEALQDKGLATLLLDLLTEDEERLDRVTAHLRFDIQLLAERLEGATEWLRTSESTNHLHVGFFGASTGAAAALIAAANTPAHVSAVVSRGGRPDLAIDVLPRVDAPTLLIVGSRDQQVIPLNEKAYDALEAEKKLEIVPGATHLFEEEGALERVAELAGDWFAKHISDAGESPPDRGKGGARKPEVHVQRTATDIAQLVADAAEAFTDVKSADLGPLLDRIGDARVVLIGEATHGTSEFYTMRQRITQELIQRRGFDIVAAEADWPDAEHVDEYVRSRPEKPERAWDAFSRFPSWMWRNYEVLDFVTWLRDYNEGLIHSKQKVGFYGLDIYSLYASIHEVVRYLSDVDPQLARMAQERYDCLRPFRSDPGQYGRAVISNRYRECEEEVTEILKNLLQRRMEYSARDGESYLDAMQNARVVASAERFYTVMYYGAPDSWNLRDSHMFETLKRLLEHRGESSKAVVWAHNSHVGDAGATSMGRRGETNIGELARQEFRGRTYTIGFGTHAGTVAAASNWGGGVEFKNVRPSWPESYERLCHQSGVPNFFLPLRDAGAELHAELLDTRLERAIGVIYRPETELQSHYFEAELPKQFDEYIWFDTTHAVRPFERANAPELPERHPFLLAD